MDPNDIMALQIEPSPEVERIASILVDAAFAVHSELGPGLLENVYEVCLAHELTSRGLRVQRQFPVPVVYDGITFEAGFRIDIVINDQLLVELKAVEALLPVHKAQVITYLKLSRHNLGFLINFNVPRIKDGIKRVICSSFAPSRLGG